MHALLATVHVNKPLVQVLRPEAYHPREEPDPSVLLQKRLRSPRRQQSRLLCPWEALAESGSELPQGTLMHRVPSPGNAGGRRKARRLSS